MLDQALQVLAQAIYVLVFILSLIECVRRRDRASLEVAALFASLGLAIILGAISAATRASFPAISRVAVLLVLAQPYLLLRVVEQFRSIPRAWNLIGLVGLLGSWAIFGVWEQPPVALTLLVIAYFAGIDFSAGQAFVRGARSETGNRRRRLTLAALGSGALATVIFLAGITTAAPSTQAIVSPISQILNGLAALAYYFAFAPPSWVRDYWRGLRLAGQVTALVVVATGVTAIGTAGSVAVQLRQSWTDQAFGDQRSLARLAAASVSQQLSGARNLLAVVANAPSLRDAVDPEPWQVERVQEAVDHLRSAFPNVGNVWVLDQQGSVRVTTESDKSLVGANFADRENFQGAVRTGAPYLSSPFRALTGQPALTLSAPVFGRSGALRAVVTTSFNLQELADRLAESSQLPNTQIMVVSTSGQIAIHPDLTRVLQPANQETALAEAALAGGSGATVETPAGGGPDQLVSYAQVPDIGWAVVLLTPSQQLFGPLTDASTTAGVVSISLIILLAAVSVLCAVVLIRPLRGLSEAAQVFGAGNYKHRVQPSGAEDLRALGQHFNTMAAQVDAQAAQLRERSDALQEASRLKSEFLANMSHELRTPLNAIIGFSELLLMEPSEVIDPDSRRRYLETVASSGKHLLALINDILDLSKIEAGKMELHVEPFDVADLVSRTVNTLEPLAAKTGIALTAEADGAGELIADEGKVKQILYNLLANAIKFTPEGGSVVVSAHRLPREVQFTVADTGIGIAPGDHERVFQEFQQVEGSASRRFEGTGLGLALTKRFVELHGGRIWLESALGQGSRFHVALPLVPVGSSSARDGADASRTAVTEARAGPATGPLVLVAEDDPRSANLLMLYLGRGGYRSELAIDGAQAVAKAGALQPAAVTLDILMPKLDGWEVLRSLKSNQTTRDIPVVIVSVVQNEELGYALGAHDYFVKPVDREALLASIGRHAIRLGADNSDLRVLVVDDEPSAVALLAGMLEPGGCVVFRAGGGREGIAVAEKERPDVILLDLMMPEVSGFDVVVALKGNPTTAGIPILVITAKDLTDEDKRLLNGQVVTVLHKGSVGRVDLLEWLDRLTASPGGSKVTTP